LSATATRSPHRRTDGPTDRRTDGDGDGDGDRIVEFRATSSELDAINQFFA
jgi:hypothetical protein